MIFFSACVYYVFISAGFGLCANLLRGFVIYNRVSVTGNKKNTDNKKNCNHSFHRIHLQGSTFYNIILPQEKGKINMEKNKIERINFLAKKGREGTLTDAEKIEQNLLRQEYVAEFRASLRGTLDNTYIQYPDGTKKKAGK